MLVDVINRDEYVCGDLGFLAVPDTVRLDDRA